MPKETKLAKVVPKETKLAKVAKEAKDRNLFSYQNAKGQELWGIQYFDSEGNRHRERAGSKSSAKDLLTQRKEEVRRGKKPRKPLSVAELVAKYLPEMLANNPKSSREYQREGKVWVEVFGKVLLDDLQPGDIEAWRAKRLKTVSVATTNRSIAFLKRLFNLAIRDEITERNPLAKGRVRTLKENNPRDRILTAEEEAAVRESVPRLFSLAILIALQCGLRQSEQFQGRRGDVDFKRKLLRLPDSKGGGRVFVRLNQVALEAFKEVLSIHSSDWIFPDAETGRHLTGSQVTHRFQRACEKLEIMGTTWHCLRHSFVSRLCMLGVPLPTVQKLARHKSIQVTLRYAHLCPSHEEESLELLGRSYPPETSNENRTAT